MVAVILIISMWVINLKDFNVITLARETDEYSKWIGDGIEVIFQTDGVWQGAYNATITIKNIGNEKIENWAIQFDLPNDITNIWNGNLIEKNNHTYVVKNQVWNQDIEQGETVSFGFLVINGDSKRDLQNVKLSCIRTGKINTSTEDNRQLQDKTDDNLEKEEVTKTHSIDIDTNLAGMELNECEDGNYYYVSKEIGALCGSIQGEEDYTKISYEVKDSKNIIRKSGNISISESWRIEDFGLVVGLNTLVIKSEFSGEKLTEEYLIINTNFMSTYDAGKKRLKIAEQIIDCLPTKDRVAIIAYNTKVKELSPFTTDKRQLKSVLKDIGQNGDRSFEEARKYAQTLLNQEDTDREKCVVVLSDSIWGMYVSVSFNGRVE